MTKNEMKLLRITKVSSDWLWPDTHQTSFIVPYTRCICIHRKTVLSIRISGKKGETCIAIADRLNTMAQDILFSNSFDLWQSDSCSYLVWHCHWFNFFSVVKYSWSFFWLHGAHTHTHTRARAHTHTHTHTHTRLTAFCPGLPGWAGTRKVKPIWILLKQETVSGSGISWAICKSALAPDR